VSEPAALPPPAPKPYPGFAQALLVAFLFLIFASLGVLPGMILTTAKFPRLGMGLLFLGQLGGMALTVVMCQNLGQKSWKEAFPTRAVAVGVWPATLVAVAGLILVLNGLEGWLSRLLPAPDWFRQGFMQMGWPALVLGAPLSEEPIFRGLILAGFLQRYGTRKALLYSALLFGLVHLNPWQFPVGLLLGLFLGWITLRTGSIWPAVFGHVLNNLSATVAHTQKLPYLSGPLTQPLWLWMLGFALAGTGLALLHRLMKPGSAALELTEATT
jgi:hypothetical protein